MEHKQANSYGVIPLYKDEVGYRILIVQNSKGGHWGLPKGTPENLEVPLETAVRELYEETGVAENDIQIKTDQNFIERYSFQQDNIIYDKTNTYFIGFVEKTLVGSKLDEINEVRWVSFSEAREILTHQSIIDVLDQVERYLESYKN